MIEMEHKEMSTYEEVEDQCIRNSVVLYLDSRKKTFAEPQPITQMWVMVHLILSDMAPKASGARDLDHTQIIDLSYSVLRFAIKNARYDSDFLCKVWDGYKLKEFKNELEKYYERVKLVKPNASRTDSSETFVLGRNFKKILEN
ncbi:hypothetical protein Avbf_03962 [Armadillidium vulgare]|nr:hypothetical protein Avbf_03962 [Armadillidium vulgare]